MLITKQEELIANSKRLMRKASRMHHEELLKTLENERKATAMIRVIENKNC